MQIQCNSLVNYFIASCDINNNIFHLKASRIPRFIDKKLKIYAKTTEAPFSLSRAIIHVQIRLGHFQITQTDRKKPRRIRHVCTVLGLWGMYKRSEPIKSLHSVQNHMANVYSSEVCLQTKNFPKISKFFFFQKHSKI